MPEKRSAIDSFANIAAAGVTQTAANTMTFNKIESGISIGEKRAWVIHRIEYTFNQMLLTILTDDGDGMSLGFTTSQDVTELVDCGNPAVLDFIFVTYMEIGAPAGFGFQFSPHLVKDFSSLPGGGLIVPPNPLYFAMDSSGLAAASNAQARLYYTILDLSPDDMWELMQARQIIG